LNPSRAGFFQLDPSRAILREIQRSGKGVTLVVGCYSVLRKPIGLPRAGVLGVSELEKWDNLLLLFIRRSERTLLI